MHGSCPPSPEELTVSLWSDLQELKDAISMSARARPWQKTKKFLDGLEGDFLDEELAAIKRYVERRSREAAQMTVTPVSTVQRCIPHSPPPEIPSDVCVHMAKKEAGMMDPGKISSNHHRLVRVLKHPDIIVPRTGRQNDPLPTAVCLLTWARTRGEFFFPPLKSL